MHKLFTGRSAKKRKYSILSGERLKNPQNTGNFSKNWQNWKFGNVQNSLECLS